ncbi:gamma-butyrobetaine dioxygenase, partial [Acipenser oxyrinchus oxyrinchus]
MDGVTPAIRQVQALDAERYVSIQWEDGTWSLYPYVWLWDNCQWAHCFLHLAKARRLLLADLDVTTAMERVTLTEPTKVSVVWPDQHTSEFDAEWLKKRCFSQSARQQQQEELFLNGRNLSLKFKMSKVSYIACRWTACSALARALHKKGFVLLLTNLVSYIDCFHFVLFLLHTWQVQDKADANNVAYTSEKLSLHSDYPALHNPPGVQFLHCIKQAAKGGEIEIVDGFHTANQLRKENPEAFQLLSSPKTTVTTKCSPRTQSLSTHFSVYPLLMFHIHVFALIY